MTTRNERPRSAATVLCGLFAGILMASAAAAEPASVTPKGATKDRHSESQSNTADLEPIAAIIADMAAKQMNVSERRQDGPAPLRRKLQLKGLGVTYQMNDRLSIESGVRLGIGADHSGVEQQGATLPSQASPGGFIKLRRQLGGR
jgi:hypothetical protein